jgi:hypothetical protein
MDQFGCRISKVMRLYSEVAMKTALSAMMVALTLIASTGSAKIPPKNEMKLLSPDFSAGETFQNALLVRAWT